MNSTPLSIITSRRPFGRLVAGRIGALTLVAAIGLSACASGSTGARSSERTLPDSRPNPVTGGTGPRGATEPVVAAAVAFLDILSAEQRDRAVYDVADPALREWIYFPTSGDRNGVALGELDNRQQAAALGVAEALLSDAGYLQLRGVIAAEDALGVRNNDDNASSDRYFIAFFGEPSATERFTVQITGHHLAVNHTYEDGRISPTPAFTGVDPVDFEVGGERLRPMLAEAQAVSALLDGLDEGTLAAARIGPNDDVLVGTGQSDDYPQAEGIVVGQLDDGQRELVRAAVQAWVGDTDERVATPLLAEYWSQLDQTRLAWSGSTDPDTPGAYLRIDGPRLWIEFANVGRFGNGDNHYHSVYRDKDRDYLG